MCLLRCPSLHDTLTMIILMPVIVALHPGENHIVCKINEDLCTLTEIVYIFSFQLSSGDINFAITYADYLGRLAERCSLEFRYLVTRVWLSYVLHNIFLLYISHLSNNASVRYGNKLRFQSIKNLFRAVQKNRVDIGYHYISIALGMYKLRRYEEAMTILDKLKIKLRNSNTMNAWELSHDKYMAAGGENTHLIKMLRNVVAGVVQLRKAESVPELELEHCTQEQELNERDDQLNIPPFVLTHFLTFLSNLKLENHVWANEALRDLFFLVHSDNGHHIQEIYRAISWEVLGICQEMVGDYQGAYQSFTTALQQPDNYFHLATQKRLQNLHERYNFNN